MQHNLPKRKSTDLVLKFYFIKAYENYLTKVKQASSNTISSYMRDIRQFSDWLNDQAKVDVLDATQLNISEYLRVMEAEGRSAETVSRTALPSQ